MNSFVQKQHPRMAGLAPAPAQTALEGRSRSLRELAASRIGHEFNDIPVRSREAAAVQAKLPINAPGDASEQEAERVAEQVIRMPAQHLPSHREGECPRCESMKPTRFDERVQTEVPPSVHEALQSPGQPLDAGTRAFFEPRFGHSFSAVRVHADAAAARSARDIGARAFAAGRSIVFAEGQYSASTPDGRRLLAHELTHVLQQGKGVDGVVQRAPWGSCPEGPRRSARNPFIYGAAELYAVGQYLARHPGHCVLTNEMLAAGIVPNCSGEEKVMVDAIMRDFHHEIDVNRRSVASPRDVTRRPEARAGALIQAGLEKVKALQQPDIVDVTTREIYDITTVGQREVKSNKFKSRYLPLLSAITRRSWSAGTRLRPLTPLHYKVPKLGTLCFGPTDLARWPGVIQYEVIKPEGDKKTKEEGKKKPADKAPGGNLGFGIGVFSSGGGKGNATLGVAINVHGAAYGTVSAGIIYDSYGNAVGVASAGAGAQVNANVAGGASAGAARRTSTDAALAAGVGSAKDTDATALANASAGSAQRSSSVTIATAGEGDAKDLDVAAAARKGAGHGSPEADGGKAATGGLQIPGKSDAEVAAAVADAARIDAQLQNASAAQKELLAFMAQQTQDLQYQVPDVHWTEAFMKATEGLSEADIRFLMTQNWRPSAVTAEELRRQIDEKLRNRGQPQQPRGKVAEPPRQPVPAPKGGEKPDGGKGDDKGSVAELKQLDGGAGPASLDDRTDSRPVETEKQAFQRLLERARNYDWKSLRAVGILVYGKEGRVYAPEGVSGALYISTIVNGKRARLTADVSGLLTKGQGGDVLEIRSCSIVVSADGRSGAGTMFVGQKITFQP